MEILLRMFIVTNLPVVKFEEAIEFIKTQIHYLYIGKRSLRDYSQEIQNCIKFYEVLKDKI